jgi:hypothetical protein
MEWNAAQALRKFYMDADVRATYRATFTYFLLAPRDALVQIEAVN